VADGDRTGRGTAARAGGIGLGAMVAIAVSLLRFVGRHVEEHPAEMVAPADVVVTTSGDIAVADPGAHRVFLVSGDDIGVLVGSGADGAPGAAAADGAPAGTKPAGDPLEIALGEPGAVFVDGGGLYVADRELGAVLWLHDVDGERRLDPLQGDWESPQRIAGRHGSALYAVVGPTVGGTGPAQVLVRPDATLSVPRPVEELGALDAEPRDIGGLAAGSDGTLYCWLDGQGLFTLRSGGAPQRLVAAGSGSDSSRDGPDDVADIALGAGGDVAVAEPDAQRVTVFGPDGGVRRRVELPFPPAGVAFAGDGSLVVLHAHDPDRAFLYRIGTDDDAPQPIGPHAARARAADRLSTATTTTSGG
jgi:hypothetical protein